MNPPALRRSAAILLFAAFAFGAHADDWFVKGRVYNNVKVLKVNPDTVSITYDGGTGRLALADLPPDIAKRFAADAKKAQAFALIEKQAETDPIAHLVVSLEPMGGMWENGMMVRLSLPPKSTPAELVAGLSKANVGYGFLRTAKVLESRAVEVTGETYTAVRVQSGDKDQIILFRYEGGPDSDWFQKIFASGY